MATQVFLFQFLVPSIPTLMPGASEEPSEPTPNFTRPSFPDDPRCQTWFSVGWRQQQLTKLGVFDIFNPAEVQEPQCGQWG